MEIKEEEVGEEDKKSSGMWKRGPSSKGGGGGGDDAVGGNSGGVSSRLCQVEKCSVDLSSAKQYYRRHKVCEVHAKAPEAIVAGLRQRFCQQCSRFHELIEFDESKRSCRRRLAGHNERRRKSSGDNNGEGSSGRGSRSQFPQTRERIREPPTTNPSSKRTQI